MIGTTRNADVLDPQRATWAFVAAIGSALFAIGLPPIPDHAYQFYLGSQVLAGARLYVDVAAADMHPPLFTWMAAATEAVARIFAITGVTLYHGIVVGIAVASITAIRHIGRASGILLIALVAALFALAGPAFGQGEHLALVLSLPYLFASAGDARGIARTSSGGLSRGAVAVAAALGLAMKPYFALVWIGTELYLARERGWRSIFRLESVTIGCLFVLYVIATLMITPEFFDLLPWIMALYPRYVAIPLPELVFDWRSALLLAGLIAAWSVRRDDDMRALADLLGIAALAMFTAMLLQAKGWDYHWYPVCALAIILISLRFRHIGSYSPAVAPVFAMAAIAAMVLQVDRTTRQLAGPPASLPALYRIVDRYPSGSAVVALTQYIHAGFPLTNLSGMHWVMPYAHLWMIPAIRGRPLPHGRHVAYDDTARWHWLERQIYDRTWAAITEHSPAVVIIERPGFGGMDMRRYFERDSRFREYFQHLELVDTVGFYVVYDTMQDIQ